MMIRVVGLLMFSLIIVHNGTCQSIDDFPVLTKTDLPKAKFTGTREFNGESLYGYIDGGADLYLEYGFASVRVTELVQKRDKFKIEVWKMNDPESGFGIFSVSRFRCNDRPDFSTFTCLNKYQLQICAGSYYMSIINESGTPESSEESLIMGKILAGKIREASYDPAGFFPDIQAQTIRNQARVVKGKLGIINGIPELEEFFKGAESFSALILRTDETTMISITFKNSDSLQKFSMMKWDQSTISESSQKMKEGETVRKTGQYRLLIEMPAK
jgi:hypothetical protein